VIIATCQHVSDFIVRNARDKADARRNRRRRAPASPADLRECEINKIIDHVFGAGLSDDDFGRDVLFEALNQIALRGAGLDEMRDHALDLLPEIGDDGSLDIMIEKIGKGRRRSADHIARALGVTYEMRTFLDLRTIGASDMPKAERAKIQRQKEAADKRWQREQAGAKPQAQSAARNKPWIARGMSRATYYRNKAAEKSAAQNSPCDRFGDHNLFYFPPDKSVSGRGAPCGRLAAALRSAGDGLIPAVDPTPPCQAPSFDRQQQEAIVSELPTAYGADLSEVEAERARHVERVQRALALCQRAFFDQFGQPLGEQP
jgi:hypothetical protein